ncbi:MAG: metallophosphoesterase [bacterium]
MRIAAIGDIHCKTNSFGLLRQLLGDIEEKADLLVLAGDLTNIGLPAEMEILLKELDYFCLPVVAVPGNHDHENGQIKLLVKMMTSHNICVLDGTDCLIDEIGLVGVKGFCGGFGKLHVQPFGEQALKDFIQVSINDTLLLEKALNGLNCQHRIGILHYSPIKATLIGEEPELYPFLGSSLFADLFDRYGVDIIIHAHAHNGSPIGFTPCKIPVHNVSRFVQTRFNQCAYYLFDLN